MLVPREEWIKLHPFETDIDSFNDGYHDPIIKDPETSLIFWMDYGVWRYEYSYKNRPFKRDIIFTNILTFFVEGVPVCY